MSIKHVIIFLGITVAMPSLAFAQGTIPGARARRSRGRRGGWSGGCGGRRRGRRGDRHGRRRSRRNGRQRLRIENGSSGRRRRQLEDRQPDELSLVIAGRFSRGSAPATRPTRSGADAMRGPCRQTLRSTARRALTVLQAQWSVIEVSLGRRFEATRAIPDEARRTPAVAMRYFNLRL